jgi:hypothetical protein
VICLRSGVMPYPGPMLYRQDLLRSGTTERTCWIRADVRRGSRVTLKNSEEPGRLWDVVRVGAEPRDLSEINRGWDNNI